jgi:integrase
MSVQRVQRHGRVRWEVRWREQTRHRSRLFDRRADAQAWDIEVRRRRQLGALALAQLTTAAPTLGEWIEQRWAPEHGATLEQSTRERYANVYSCHVAPWLNDVPLSEITIRRLRTWQADRLADGVSPGTIHKARTLLSSVLRHAAEDEAIPGNPLSLVRAPKPVQRDGIRPLAPVTVEAIRRLLLEPAPREVAASAPGRRSRRSHMIPARDPQTCRRDALIVSLLAYSGLRPGELRALRWQDIGERGLLIQRGTAPDGTVKATKNVQTRTVRLLTPLAAELREWRLAAGRPPDQALVIAGPGGEPWTKTDWQNWRSRQWAPACRQTGLERLTAGRRRVPRPYDLRHGFASLLLAEGRQPLYVAQQLGHSLAVLLSHYAHLISEFEDAERVDAEREITKAREAQCTSSVRQMAG